MKRVVYILLVLALLLVLVATAAAGGGKGNGARKSPLQPGWDSQPPLNMGKVIWNTPDDSGRLQLTYILDGAVPNVNAVVGLYDITSSVDPDGSGMFSDNQFGLGWGSGCWTREGESHCHEYWNIGRLQTDEFGNGSAHFDLTPAPGTYKVQFYIWQVPGYSGVAYESGGIFGSTVDITIP